MSCCRIIGREIRPQSRIFVGLSREGCTSSQNAGLAPVALGMGLGTS